MGILAGAATYAALAMNDVSMTQPDGNTLVIGQLGATGEGYVDLLTR